MRLTILFTLLALLTIAMAAPSPPDKGWRDYDVSDIVKNGEPRFAEYDMEKCVDVFGKPKPNFKDFSPVAGKCYDIKKSTVSIYHERGFTSMLKLYPEYGCGGEVHIDHDHQACQNVQRRWEPYHVRSFRMR